MAADLSDIDDLEEKSDEKTLKRLRVAALNTYDSVDGRMVIDAIVELALVYDEPQSENDMVLHLFGQRLMHRLFGLFEDDLKQHSQMTEALINMRRGPFGIVEDE